MHSSSKLAEDVLHPRAQPGTADRGDDDAASILREVMSLARTELRMEAAFVAEVTDGRHVIRVVDGDGAAFGLSVDQETDARTSLCARMLDGEIPGVISDAGLPEFGGVLGVGAWVGLPIRRPDGSVYGTLCCMSHRPDPALAGRDLGVMRLLARLIGSHVEEPGGAAVLRDESVARIRRAIEDRDMLRMVVQPVTALGGGEPVGFEALARFVAEPVRSPDAWFAEATSVGLGLDLELAAFRAALPLLDDLPDGMFLSVNVSPRCVVTRSLRREIAAAGDGLLIIELTEQEPVDDYPALIDALDDLRAAGVGLAVDDVGAGFSSMRHVLQLEPDMMKLDASLARDVELDARRQAMVAAMTSFAESSRIELVAEGIETSRQMETLRELGVPFGQGFYIARPDVPSRHLVRGDVLRRGGLARWRR